MIYVTKHAHQFSSPPGQAGAIEVTPAMVEAGVEELRDFRLGDDLSYRAEQVFRAMAYAGGWPDLKCVLNG